MRRNRLVEGVLLTFFTGIFFSFAGASERLTKEEVRQLITGNTIEEVHVAKPWKNKFYFISDGKFKRIDQNGNPYDGKWDFDPDGSLCLERKKRKCWYLEIADKDVYHVISRRRGQHTKTWRMIKGNPYNL